MSEFLRTKVIAAGLLAAIGLTACASDGNTTANDPKPSNQKRHSAPTVPNVSVEYFANGSRELITSDMNNSKEISNDSLGGGGDTYLTDIVEFCDGRDLVEETKSYTTYNHDETISTGLSRSVNHPACDDGKLTPSDFSTPRSSAENR